MIKEYHVSENLFDGTYTKGFIGTTYIYRNTGTSANCAIISVSPNTTYTVTKYDESNRFAIGTSSVLPYDEIQLTGIYYVDTATTYTFTTDNSAQYMVVYVSTGTEQAEPRLMINEGQTALPYEPYGNTWNTQSYCKATTGGKTYSNFPIVVRSREQSISSWNMKGNEQHTGTASPTSPIEINGTGERTANLFDLTSTAVIVTNCTMSVDNGVLTQVNTGGTSRTAWKFDNLQVGTDYTLSVNFSNPNGSECQLRVYDSDNNLAIKTSSPSRATTGNLSMTFTAETSTHYIRIYSNTSNANSFTVNFTDIMFNTGSRALPYEPYGQYKISIVSNQTALTPVYLTEQLMKINDYADRLASSGSLIRYIKKIELKGTEGWTTRAGTPANIFFCERSDTNFVNNCALCTHYINQDEGSFNDMQDKHILVRVASSGDKTYIGIRDSSYPQTNEGASQLASYLAAQYAAGTPVTVYYVLATPTTEQVTVPTIPATSSPTTIDVNTSIKPSEMSLTYDGYKICKKQKYQNNAWT